LFGISSMKTNVYGTSLLLLAIMLATTRPAFTSSAQGGMPASRGTNSPAEERDGSESERESEAEKGAEGRKTRRLMTLVRLDLIASRLSHGAPVTSAGISTAEISLASSEHLLRWGIGAPLRI
jgi:hypothetical protein